MKIGLESSSLLTDKPTGVSNYTRLLLENLELIEDLEIDLFLKFNYFKKRTEFPLFNARNTSWYFGTFSRAKSKINIAHSPDLKFLSLSKAKKIITAHDFAIFQTQNQIPGYTSQKYKNKVYSKMKSIVKKIDAVVSVSEATKRDFLEMFDFDENKIYVTPLAPVINTEKTVSTQVLSKYNLLPENYLLFVGTISIRKNILNILDAFKKSKLHQDYKLVLAGALSMGNEKILEKIDELKLSDQVIVTGYLNDDSVIELYQNAKAFVFPTYYEGFGIPILEAMLAKTPVLIGNLGAAPEVSAGFAEVCNPFSVESIAESLQKIVSNPKNTEFAYEYAKQFSWMKTALQTVDVYKKIL